METNKRNGKKDLTKLGKEVDEALRKATREALKKHQLAGNKVAICHDGKIIIVKPEEIFA